MCGIAGFFNCRVDFTEHDLDTMTRALAHRGPDGQGIRFLPKQRLGLGHRRLAIVDLSEAANQPMEYFDSGLSIIFNGEIYNFIELRQQLEALGHRFRTHGDTEVVLAAFQEWGKKAFQRFNGMFALAIYNAKTTTLTLCVDRFGIKPLYYYRQEQGVLFASEQKAFFPLASKIGLRWDDRGVLTALCTLGTLEASGKTVFSGLESLKPGHFIEVSPSGIKLERWWNTADNLEEVGTYEQQKERFREIFYDACRIRLRTDVPIATSLSGGLDSSAVVGTIKQIRDEKASSNSNLTFPFKTFIHRFPQTDQDESIYAEEVVRRTGLEAVFVEAKSHEIADQIDHMLWHFESIYPGMPDSAWRIYAAQRAHGIPVSLDGHGADEMLGGYQQYYFYRLLEALPNPFAVWNAVEQIQELMGPYFSTKALLSGIIRSGIPADDTSSLILLLKRMSDPVLKTLKVELNNSSIYSAPKVQSPKNFDLLNQVLYKDFHSRVLPRILKNFDLTSMANGIEVRMPFMDYRLVQFSFSLPSSSKIGGGYTKRILRDALSNELPEMIRTRKLKLGFNSPLLEWSTTSLRPWIESTLAQNSGFDHLIDRKKLLKYYRTQVLTNRVEWRHIVRFWAFVSAIRWSQLYQSSVKS